jgi:hypothetical protein
MQQQTEWAQGRAPDLDAGDASGVWCALGTGACRRFQLRQLRISRRRKKPNFCRATPVDPSPGNRSCFSVGQMDSDRELLSTTMQEALACWQHCVRKDQIALALESKVWGAYLDKSNGVWKAPGIRHYLSSASMPKNPRWRKVVQTAEFVLHQTAEDDPHREKLANLVQDVYRQYTVK